MNVLLDCCFSGNTPPGVGARDVWQPTCKASALAPPTGRGMSRDGPSPRTPTSPLSVHPIAWRPLPPDRILVRNGRSLDRLKTVVTDRDPIERHAVVTDSGSAMAVIVGWYRRIRAPFDPLRDLQPYREFMRRNE